MSYELLGGFSMYIILISIAEAAITPQDRSYSASVDDDVTFPWVYGNEADMLTVAWTFKKPSATLATSIMFQSKGSPAVPSSNYNVEHNGNGEITLKKVNESDSGIYYCEVTYTLSSGHDAVTGTATLTVFAPTTSDCGCKSLDNCDISEGVCILLWFIIGILIAAVLIIVIILILHYCFDVKIPCCTCCKTNSTAGEPQGTQNREGQNLHNRDSENSAYYTKKRPPAKLEQLDKPESEKHHIGGRPLPQIGKYN